MRSFSSDIITKSAQTNQTIAADADPYVSLRIARARTILDNMDLTEKVRVRRTDPNTITDADVAIQHPRFKGENTKIWVAYIRSNRLGIRWAYDRENITEMSWNSISPDIDAIACAICFDSDVKENARGIAEFVTIGEYPYIFYIDTDGALHYLMLGGVIIDEVLVLENVTDVSAIRGPSAKHGDWDLGLTVFFLMNGVLYYRQCIDGTWYDAEQVNLSITGETIVKIDAFNTWDYRVGVQVLTQSGKLYQLITYTEGIGARGSEHIEAQMSANVTLSGIEYRNKFLNEHIEIGTMATVRLIYGLSALPVSVGNVEDENENWGTTIQIVFDYPVYSDGLTTSMFTLVDSNGNNYVCDSFSISGNGTGKILTLMFNDFNLAYYATNITVSYTKPVSGGLMSPATQTNSFSLTFVPINLVDLGGPPEFLDAWNDSKGEKIYLQFDSPITNADFTDVENSLTVITHEYTYVPHGTLESVIHAVDTVSEYDGTILSGATCTDTEETENGIRLEVSSGG